MERAQALLASRTLQTMKVNHWLKQGEDYTCLDFNVSAPSQDELRAKVIEVMAKLRPDELLPAAPQAAWLHFMNQPFLETTRMRTSLAPQGVILVSVRGK